MIQKVSPGERSGTVEIPASKSVAHRLLICAALYGEKDIIRCEGISRDIQATICCLSSMGAKTFRQGQEILTHPCEPRRGEYLFLPCGESGSTLRFLLPVVGALGLTGEFLMEGRLPDRPLQPLWDLLEAHGMNLSRMNNSLLFSGKLQPGNYTIPGNISSQFVSGLLFALPLLDGESCLTITGTIESADYIAMTEDALQQYGLRIEKKDQRKYRILRADRCRWEPQRMKVESDWSSAAFFLSLGALSEKGIVIRGLNLFSKQGDRRILELLRQFGAKIQADPSMVLVRRGELRGMSIDASGVPDLVPVLATVASVAQGRSVIFHAERLRLKESDRLQATTNMLKTLGADIEETEDGLSIFGKPLLQGGTVSSFHDHRIAMSAAVAASVCQEAVVIEDAESTEKSFPGFWHLLNSLEKGESAR